MTPISFVFLPVQTWQQARRQSRQETGTQNKADLEAQLLVSFCVGLHEMRTVVFSQEVFPNTCLQAHAKSVVQTSPSIYYVYLVIADGPSQEI